MTSPQPAYGTGMSDAQVAPLTQELRVALALADIADGISMAAFLASDLKVQTKPDRTPVTEADQRTEQALRAMIREEYPADGLVGEEYGSDIGGADRVWVIDPIDGTANFLRGVPVWATLIALVDRGVPVLGVVSAPALGRRWWAASGSAFTRDVDGTQRSLQVSSVADLSDSSLSYSDPIGWPDDALSRLSDRCWRTRGYGDFLSHVWVAEGAVDVAIEPDLAPWDVAALLPIVIAAGGQVVGLSGEPVLHVQGGRLVVPAGLVSTNSLLTDQVLETIGHHS